MKKVAFALLIGAVAMPAALSAQTYDRYGNRVDYRYANGHYYHHHRCGGGNGAVGTVAGGVGGAVIGNAIGGGALGTVAGGVGGALLGRHLDKEHTRDKNGC
jgi:hypothetical protein